jgi:hypothetical protein
MDHFLKNKYLLMRTYTSDDLLLYHYGEASNELQMELETALETDWSLRERMEMLRASIEDLNQLQFAPNRQSLDRILAYGRESIGQVGLAQS